MPYWLETDTFFDDPAWEELVRLGGGRGRGALYNALKASYCDLKAFASRHMSNGWLTEERALYLCRGKRTLLELLCTSALGREPLVHARGEVCESPMCLPGGWLDGYAFYVHDFLKRNPARKETQRDRAQKADRDDKRLRDLVYERDGGCCRYCRSGPINKKTNDLVKDRRKRLHFDHVDPDQPAGADGENFVTACAECNEHKGHHTPREKDMVLLAEPTAEERAVWLARPQIALFRREDWGPEHAHIIVGSSPTSSSDHPADHLSDDDPLNEPSHDGDDDPGDDATGEVRPDPAGDGPGHEPDQRGKGPGSGRVGQSDVPGGDAPARASPRKPLEAQPRRSSADPDIYHRRSRASPPADPDLHPYIWPPGSFPAERRPRPPEEEREPWT